MDDVEDKQPRTRISDIDRALRDNSLRRDRDYGGLIEEIARIARRDATPENDGHWPQHFGFEVVDQIVAAVNEDPWDFDRDGTSASGRRRVIWRHIARPVLVRKKRNEPFIDKSSLEAAASNYLALPYRVDRLDRMLVDLLIAQEMFAFADEMQPVLRRWMPAIPKWLLGNALSLMLGFGLAALLHWSAPESTAMTTLAVIVAILTALNTAWSLLVFPFAYPAMRRQTKQVHDLLAAMTDAYAALTGSPTSTKYLQDRVLRAADIGVRWPSALIVLLEDIEARRSAI